MAATSHPLATLAAVEMLRSGGNAMDAAVCAAAVQAVVEPQSTGIGGDCFVLYCPNGQGEVLAFNGSGRAPAAATAEWYLDRGHDELPESGPHAVTVPGRHRRLVPAARGSRQKGHRRRARTRHTLRLSILQKNPRGMFVGGQQGSTFSPVEGHTVLDDVALFGAAGRRAAPAAATGRHLAHRLAPWPCRLL
ncbi:hypothetical protein BQ8794_330015 [Mesorhizobium prunaredense]|uniref:Gamma-glutamyltransferase n=1 Tax=Mesorhizobium prunaredense TaxID=1631249 RepID=A0A1R3VDH7_9HYPH|nr:gamma-glutamyltransferase [Mesorhizobium prunaredense]SIT57304.1 hypothetical protein BQ8794_330015 [Mesorhizobium prunaredense]